MKTVGYLFVILFLTSLTGCMEIIDDLSLNEDGSGVFKYNVNLSSSKVKINSLLALDSLDGQRVPSLDEIKESINRIMDEFKKQDGISNVSMDANYSDYVFKFQCDFSSLEELQAAIKEVIRLETKEENTAGLSYDWVSFDGDILKRSVPQITIKKASEINQSDVALLKEGSYTSITRFDRTVDHFDNQKAVLSKNQKAVMVRTDPYSLIQNHQLLDNNIYLVKSE